MAHPMGDMRLNTPYCTVLSSVWCLYFLHTLEGVKESRDVRNGPQNFFSAVRTGCLQPVPGLEQDFPVNSDQAEPLTIDGKVLFETWDGLQAARPHS